MMHRTSSIAIIIILQTSLCFAVRIKNKVDDASTVVGTRASVLARSCDRYEFALNCKNIPADCSKPSCRGCQECTRSGNLSDSLRRTGDYRLPGFELPDKCSVEWRMGDFLDKGAMGEILKVRKSGHHFGKYVLKKALTRDTQRDIESEIKIMSQINCKGILKVKDPAPCDKSGNLIPYAFVMRQMVPNLWKWYDKYTGYKNRCRDTIQKQLSDALKCLHSQNYIHGDFKGDQVLYRGVDPETKCPIDLTISDFGLSNARKDEKGATVYDTKYDPDYYGISGHLMGAMFLEDPKRRQFSPRDPAHLTNKEDPSWYRTSSIIDWCSFLFEMLTELANGDDDWYNSLSIPSNLRGMDCGFMSATRHIRVIAPTR